ncbi:MAG: hypothetical protein ACRDS0_23810 [Pseudonocardiaceae bacterium]
MTRDGVLDMCGSLAGAVEDYPFEVAELREMIDHSYELVVSHLPRIQRARLFGM